MTTPRRKDFSERWKAPIVTLCGLLLVAAACSGGDDRIGTMEDFCEGTGELTVALESLALEPDVTPDALAAQRDALAELEAPEELREDLDLLVDVLDEVLEALDDADLDDERVLAEVQDRLSRLEAASGEIQAAGDRVFQAMQECPAAEDVTATTSDP